MDAYGEVERGIDLVRRFEDEERDVRGLVAARCIGPSQLPVYRVVDEQAGQVIYGRFIVEDPVCLVLFVERAQQRVDLSPGAVAVVGAGRQMEPDDPLAGFAQGRRGVGDDSFVHVCEFGQQRFFFGVAACCGQTTRLVHMALDPALHGPDHPQVQCIEMLLLRGRVDLFPMFDAFDQPAPSKPYSHFIIGGEVCVVADAADDVVSGNVLFQMVVRIIRIPFVGSHLGHEIHPPPCECIVGVDIYGVYGHQVAKVVRPCVVPVKRSVGVVRQDMPHPRGRYDTPVIILVEGAFDTYFFLRLRQLAQPQPGDPFVVIFHIIGILQFAFYSVTPGYFF